MNLRNALLAATVLAVPMLAMSGAAKAQPVTGVYVGGSVGYNYMQDWDLKSASVLGHRFSGLKYKGAGGAGATASVGYGFGNGFRVELEGNYSNNDGTGTVNNYGGFVNGLFDFDIGTPWIYPYVGVGVGYEQTNATAHTFVNGLNALRMSGVDSGGVAAQAKLGAAFPIEGVPGLSFTAEYRFMALFNDPTYHGTALVGGAAAPISGRFEDQYNHAVLVGLRYAFGVAPVVMAAAPAPVAAPAPAPARTYLVFFDWDKADLTARARQIISDAAQASTHVQVTKIEVSGHADTSGTKAYNQTLSMKRAQNVSSELQKDGVPAASIAVFAYGDTRPLVPTGPGVREPQNRRVEIVLK